MIKTVLGMGTAAMDTVLQCQTLPKADAFEILQGEQLLSGGSCANMLVTLAQLGMHAKQIAKIGDDMYGQRFRQELVADGVDDSLLMTNLGGSTLHTYILAAADGQHCIFANMGNSLMHLLPEEIKPEMLNGVDLFYTDLFPCRAAKRMAELCEERNIPVIVCLQCPPDIMERIQVSKAEILEMISRADLFISGRDGYMQLTGESDYQKAVQLLYQEYPLANGMVCTAGGDGSVWMSENGLLTAGTYEVQAVDTTGAGDCFLGGLIYDYYHKGKSRQEAMDFASAIAAIKCTQLGPRIRSTEQDVLALMNIK